MREPTEGMEAIIEELRTEVVESEFVMNKDDQITYKVRFPGGDTQGIRQYLSNFEDRVEERFGYPSEKISIEKRRPGVEMCDDNERYVVLNKRY